jgi:ribose 5-phosphate isomerase A
MPEQEESFVCTRAGKERHQSGAARHTMSDCFGCKSQKTISGASSSPSHKTTPASILDSKASLPSQWQSLKQVDMMARSTGGEIDVRADATSAQLDQWKKDVGEAAAKLVENGMVVGLGSGSTALQFVAALGKRVEREGLRIVGIPTSEQTEHFARQLNIPLSTLGEHTQLDLDVDGADEIELGSLYLIKGHGGALLREKIVAAASKRMAVISDDSKLVERLGSKFAVPVEVVQFGWQVTQKRLADLGSKPALRMTPQGKPFVTDGGNYIVDCAFGPMANPKEVAHHLDHVTGAVEHGLFLGFVWEAVVCGHGGLQILTRKGP